MVKLYPHSQYYLHVNGTVHFKPYGGVDPTSDFVIAVWHVDTIGASPRTYLDWLLKLKALGARANEIERLITKQGLTDFIPDARKIIQKGES